MMILNNDNIIMTMVNDIKVMMAILSHDDDNNVDDTKWCNIPLRQWN